jgi:FkbM family methyltransferase
MSIDFDPQIYYLNYLQQQRLKIGEAASARIDRLLGACDWEQPQTPQDWNSLAVVAMVAAQSADLGIAKGLYAEIALDAAQTGASLPDAHPLCVAHLALLHDLLGNYNEGAELAFNTLINTIHSVYIDRDLEPGLVYIPPMAKTHCDRGTIEPLSEILSLDNGWEQALLLLAEALCRSQITLDHPTGIRLLHLLDRVMKQSVLPKIKLGIYSISSGELEGLLYLHQAYEIAPDNPLVVQSLYLAYRDLEQLDRARFWWETGLDYCGQQNDKTGWEWTNISVDAAYSLASYDGLLMAIEPTLQSATTRALVAEGDWFERELEFWRDYIQSGMTVIDIGASAGVYTFSAAHRVGHSGIVYAIEPFSGAVECLHRTCQLNKLENVKVFANAIGDRPGKLDLAIQSSSELSYLVTDDRAIDPDLQLEEVTCIELDDFVSQLGIDRIEIIKISVGGGELDVLKSADRVLGEFAPTILYTNYTNAGSNLAVADYLIERGYKLFRYQPYLQELIPLDRQTDFDNVMKVVAIPQ